MVTNGGLGYPVDIYGRGNKKNATPTIQVLERIFDTWYPTFTLLDEVEEWLKDNVGKNRYSLSSFATNAQIGLWATIYFETNEDAVLFSLAWG